MNKNILIILFGIVVLPGCAIKKSTADDVESKAIQLIKNTDSATLNFLKEWNYTIRPPHYVTWTKVNAVDSLEYSVLYEPIGDTVNIEIYDIRNFLRDYQVNFNIDTSYTRFDTVYAGSDTAAARHMPAVRFYRISAYMNTVTSIYPNGRISGSKNLLDTPVLISAVFPKANPFTILKSVNQNESKFSFGYCNYTPAKGNFIRFAFYNTSNENILYYLPDDLTIKDTALFKWVDKFSKGKRLGKNWILVEKDNYNQ
ncbi:hypothetical protein [Ferruginibacter sp. SUN106]|uniref:hypothetical protein n=1 Tax=Ferruginibacter sp. SUN106 TaxID=2978348 RepID=UPI003D366342